jgi:DNA-binding transcriptional ArsR family regulator
MMTGYHDTEKMKMLLKIVTNQTRMKMLVFLHQAGIAQSNSFTRMIGVSQPQASKNLKLMTASGIVQKQKIGRSNIYSLDTEIWGYLIKLSQTVSST